MKRWILASVFTSGAALATACYVSSGSSQQQQGSSSSSSCGTLPATCDTATQPSYATDVSPILFNYCTSCHQPGGQQSGKPLDSYTGTAKLTSQIESQVSKCSMPPSSSPQPTTAERDTLLAWIGCGAPNN